MNERRCPHCHKLFYPSRSHREQTVCSDPGCQQERRSNYRRKKITADPNYREACRQARVSGANNIRIIGSSIARPTRLLWSAIACSKNRASVSNISNILQTTSQLQI